tara:strand:+ start:2751 stop:5303 length:2553 start_codon:yes stop_codon:yes gene_type:complete
MFKFKFIFFILSLVSLNLTFANVEFTDVSEDDYFYEAVNYLKNNNIVQGYDDGSFGVNKSITRAELSKIIILESNFKLGRSTKCFSDVSFKDWFSPHVCTAKAYGVVKGFDDNSFKPYNPVTKAESLKLLLFSLNIKDFKESSNQNSINMIESDWFYDMVNFADSLDIWFFDDSVSPNSLISRSEFAELFYRTHEYILDEMLFDPEAENLETDYPEAENSEDNSNSLDKDKDNDSKIEVLDQDLQEEDVNDDQDQNNVIEETSNATGIVVVDDGSDDQAIENIEGNSLLDDFEFKTYSLESFDDISLSKDFSNFYFENQVLSLNGRLDSNHESVLFAILDQDKNTVYSEVFDVKDSFFEVDSVLNLKGEYYFALIPGSSGTSKIYPVRIEGKESFNVNFNLRDEINLSFDTTFENSQTIMKFNSPQTSLYELSFIQDSKELSLFVDSNNSFVLDYALFKDFTSGEILVKGSRLDIDFDSKSISQFNDFNFDNLNAEFHNFSEVNESITNFNLPSFFIPNQEVIVSFTYDDDFKKDFYLINPNGEVESFKDQVISDGNQHSFNFTPTLSGTYVLEVNDLNGLAIINAPIYETGSDIVLPDYFDLFDSDSSSNKVDVNLMLNLVNEVRNNYGLNSVALNSDLNNLADVHLQDMIANNFFAHVNLQGQSPQDRAIELQINTVVGENLAKDLNTEKAFYSLMRSAVHRANILDESWEELGLAITESDGYVYVVQQFSFNEDTALDDLNAIVSQKLNLNTVSQNLQLEAQAWSDLMAQTQTFSTNINSISIFDGLENSGFTSFLALVGAQSDISNLEVNLNDSLENLADFAPQSYAVAVKFDGTGKFAFTIIVAK